MQSTRVDTIVQPGVVVVVPNGRLLPLRVTDGIVIVDVLVTETLNVTKPAVVNVVGEANAVTVRPEPLCPPSDTG